MDEAREMWRAMPDQEPAEPGAVHPLTFVPGRRSFLKLAGASLALASAGCTPPAEEILPFVDGRGAPAPGIPRFYASAMVQSGYARGLLVETNAGRPTKIEGNPAHPASLGATDVFAQAEVLQLWDPDRSQGVRRGTQPATRAALMAELDARVAAAGARGGEGLALLTGYVSSPTLAAQIRAWLERHPRARWHQWEPLHRDHAHRGAVMAFGRPVSIVHRVERADVVVSLDADFLGEGPGSIRDARAFTARRRRAPETGTMSRLYVAESTPTLAGAHADRRFALRVEEIERLLAQIAAGLGLHPAGAVDAHAQAIVRELKASAGRALVIAGPSLSPAAHALVHALNARLDAPGSTLAYLEPPPGAEADCTQSLARLVEDMRAGRVETLAILGGNPAYDAPADLGFGEALARVPFSLRAGLYDDETSALATWHAPLAHFLEHWSDARADDGTASIVQPVIAPLYGGMSPHELLAALARDPAGGGYETVRAHWRASAPGDFEGFWRESLRRGVIEGSAAKPLALRPRPPAAPLAPRQADGWSLRFRADDSVRDGEYANNAWLQELPRSHTKLTWDNAALVAPASARELNVVSGDMIEIAVQGRTLAAPVWVMPGHPERSLGLPLGYGRARAGRVGKGVGFDAYRLRASDAPWSRSGAQVAKSQRPRHAFATTQNHDRMEGRDHLRHASLAQFLEDRGRFRREEDDPKHSLYPPWPTPGYRWGMAIDLTACIGCNACTIACQAENNIPTVGKEEVIAGREMHWIRLDRYFEGPPEAPKTLFMPVPCMHCEQAPCEYVCPVEASVHDSEGLNVQVYNRCVGTRFCSQNCPYKVRRFNFLQYADTTTESLKAGRNPEVTVRSRGVMEKCTYCVQRITRARIEAEKGGRRIADGEVITACQAVCPTQAIAFGDMNDPKSAVNAAKASPLNYALLGELNTRPSTTYLARLDNSDPDAEEG